MQKGGEYGCCDDGGKVAAGQDQRQQPIAPLEQRGQERGTPLAARGGGLDLGVVGRHQRNLAGGEERLHHHAGGDDRREFG